MSEPSNTQSSQSTQPSQQPSVPDSSDPPSDGVKTPFEDFEAGLTDAGYKFETVIMAAELVGAKTGMKYKLDFGSAELYQFESGSDALKKAVEDGGLNLEGFGTFPCHFNGDLAVIIDVTENEDSLLDLFNEL